MALITKLKKNIRDWGATVIGLLVAIAVDLIKIDWENFEFKKEWPILLLSIIIAGGGYVSKIKVFRKKEDGPTEG